MTDEIQLSDAEKRLLRRVFHRHALPYIAVFGLIALFSLSGGSDPAAKGEAIETVPVAAPPPIDVDALQATQARAERLLAELTATREKSGKDLDAANRQIAKLEKSLGSTARKLEKVEALAREALTTVATLQVATPAHATPTEVSNSASIKDKLRGLSSKGTTSGSVAEVESAPAAPADAASERDPAP